MSCGARADGEVDWGSSSAVEIGEAIGSGKRSSREVTDDFLARIERSDPTLHAYLTVDAEGARKAADRADAEVRAGRRRSPLHGVPIAVKDLCDTAGVRTTAGLRAQWDRVPSEDACLIERLREAGAVILGKLSMSEGALGLHHPSIPPPVNPWNAERWTGISSSGSAVATASGLCAASIGSDTGGSIRVPSACCGIIGLKPTYGRVSRHGIFPLAPSLDHVGPMTRTVRDAAALLAAIAGFDARDATSLRASVPDYVGELGRGVAGLRIGVDKSFCVADVAPVVVERLMQACDVLEREGATVHEVTLPPVEPVVAAWSTISGAEAAGVYATLFPEGSSEFGPALAQFVANGAATTGIEYARAHEARMRFGGTLAGVFEQVDVLLCPALGVPVPAREPAWLAEIGSFDRLLRFTAPFNASGNPAITLPAGFDVHGLPVAIQLVGRHLDESVLLRAGGVLEASGHSATTPVAWTRARAATAR